jgi:ABC-2 type transport system ATP-binding protein
MSREKAIEIENLTKFFGDFQALKNISFDINRGEFFGYLGPNGAGKTTTIRIIIGLTNMTSGSVKVFGNDVVKDYIEARKLIGVSPQELNFDPFLKVEQSLKYQGGFLGMSGMPLNKRIEEVLEIFDLKQKRDNIIRALSGGMKRRLSIAKSIMHNPEILILDEPTAGLDLELRYEMWDYLRNINKMGKTIILTTHYIEEAEKLCDRIGVINHGKIVALDHKDNLLKKMSTQKFRIHVKHPIEKLPKELKEKGYSIEEGVIVCKCKNIETALPTFLKIAGRHNIRVSKIEMVQDRLEDIYIKLTGGLNNSG